MRPPEAKKILRELIGQNAEQAFMSLLEKLGGSVTRSVFNLAKIKAIKYLKNDMKQDPEALAKQASLKLAEDKKIIVSVVLIALVAAIDPEINAIEDVEYRDLNKLAKALSTRNSGNV